MRYLILTIKHKWFVFLAGLKIGCPIWRLIIHDLSKFRPSELPHYQRQFYGKADDPLGFALCWTRHQNRNDHHWEWWVPRTGHKRPDSQPLRMSQNALLEMMADWLGASRAYEGKWPTAEAGWPWWEKNAERILFRLHPDTADEIEVRMRSLFPSWQ